MSEKMKNPVTLRTTVEREDYDRAQAALPADATLASVMRDAVIALGATRSTDPLTTDEETMLREWYVAARYAIVHPLASTNAAWREAMHPRLVRVAMMPPLPVAGDHAALLAWTHSAHHTLCPLFPELPTPPRYAN